MENLPEVGALAAAILAGVQLVRYLVPSLSGRVATIIVTILFGAVAYLIPNGLSVIEIIIALTSQVFVYDFVVKPAIKPNKN